jgi:hypothetical protein
MTGNDSTAILFDEPLIKSTRKYRIMCWISHIDIPFSTTFLG